jgi:hypothetical protein
MYVYDYLGTHFYDCYLQLHWILVCDTWYIQMVLATSKYWKYFRPYFAAKEVWTKASKTLKIFYFNSCDNLDLGSMLWSQFSAIFDNFRRKNWRFPQKPMLWSKFCIIELRFESKTPIFSPIFCRKYLNMYIIITSVPRTEIRRKYFPRYIHSCLKTSKHIKIHILP